MSVYRRIERTHAAARRRDGRTPQHPDGSPVPLPCGDTSPAPSDEEPLPPPPMDPPAAATTTLAAAPVVPVPSLLVPTMSAGSLGDALRREEFELQRDVSHILAIPANCCEASVFLQWLHFRDTSRDQASNARHHSPSRPAGRACLEVEPRVALRPLRRALRVSSGLMSLCCITSSIGPRVAMEVYKFIRMTTQFHRVCTSRLGFC